MNSGVLGLIWQHVEIFGGIIPLVLIAMVHDLAGREWAAYLLFGDGAVFVSTVSLYVAVGFSTSSACISIFDPTFRRAKCLRFKMSHDAGMTAELGFVPTFVWNVERLPALQANQGHWWKLMAHLFPIKECVRIIVKEIKIGNSGV